jgi:Ran GTPase-activating protein (RanGAP) involved in mRNA processing and transport
MLADFIIKAEKLKVLFLSNNKLLGVGGALIANALAQTKSI